MVTKPFLKPFSFSYNCRHFHLLVIFCFCSPNPLLRLKTGPKMVSEMSFKSRICLNSWNCITFCVCLHIWTYLKHCILRYKSAPRRAPRSKHFPSTRCPLSTASCDNLQKTAYAQTAIHINDSLKRHSSRANSIQTTTALFGLYSSQKGQSLYNFQIHLHPEASWHYDGPSKTRLP